jgi:hypothetical protein
MAHKALEGENMIGKIEKVPLRDIWSHEALEFTKWLQNNCDVVSNIVGFELQNVEREQSTGNFNVDLVAEDNMGHTVVIENQLEKSNHDHLGKIITYLASMDANIAIWIVSEPRAEHIAAVSWLNESTAAKFYLLKLEGVKIGDSPNAPLLTLIVGPSDAIESVGKTKREKKERHDLRKQFWTNLLEKSKQKHNLFNAISPTDGPYISTGAGKSGFRFQFWVNQKEARIVLNIDKGMNQDDENLRILNLIKQKKNEIENAFGSTLEFDEMQEDRACVIKKIYKKGGYKSDIEQWNDINEELSSEMVKFENALIPVIKELKI